MFVDHRCAPTWRFHTKLCKFLRNISTNISGLGKRADLKLGEVSSLCISNKITMSWLYPLNGFRFIFLLHDSENDLQKQRTSTSCLLLRKLRPPKTVDVMMAIKIIYILMIEVNKLFFFFFVAVFSKRKHVLRVPIDL